MEGHYKTLLTVYNITKNEPQPESYKCRPIEIILRQFEFWQRIQRDLTLLENEGLVKVFYDEKVTVSITPYGIRKIKDDREFFL